MSHVQPTPSGTTCQRKSASEASGETYRVQVRHAGEPWQTAGRVNDAMEACTLADGMALFVRPGVATGEYVPRYAAVRVVGADGRVFYDPRAPQLAGGFVRVVFKAAAVVCGVVAGVLGTLAYDERNAGLALFVAGVAIVMAGLGAALWRGGDL